MRKLTKSIGALAVGACLFASAHAAQADFAQIELPAKFGDWGPIATSKINYPLACLFPIPCAATDFVRGQVSLRHERDRVFYNTTSNSGYYWRSLTLQCNDGKPAQLGAGGPFHTDADADLTLYCTGSSYVSATAGITSI